MDDKDIAESQRYLLNYGNGLYNIVIYLISHQKNEDAHPNQI